MPSALILTRVHLGARKEATEAELKTEFSSDLESQTQPSGESSLIHSGTTRKVEKPKKYRVTYCAHTSPLPLLPSGPGGVGGIVSRRARH